MASRSLIAVTAVLLCIAQALVSPASAARPKKGLTCCRTFAKEPVPFNRILGYREISGSENCRIKAIIFITKMKKEICAKPGDKWVKKTLADLSEKLKLLSKPAADAGENQSKKSESTSVNDGSGSFSSTTETIPDSTDGYYW